jgi:AcrR family transcriptional regulator
MNVRSEKEKARGRGRPAEGDKQRQILEAALGLFAERGFHGTRVPLVAEAAGVATGTIYHYFASKEALVNAVFRDAKSRLHAALFDGLATDSEPHALFTEIWRRLVSFARTEPVSFQFLEMQDHFPYLDAESRTLEMNVLAPLWLAGQSISPGAAERKLPVEASMALVWGALVGLIKAERLGYLTLTDETLSSAGEACWLAVSDASGKED